MLTASNVMSISIVKQCQFLDQVLGAEFTMEFLNDTQLSLKNLKNRILKADHLKTLKAAEGHPSQCYAVAVANNNAWLKLWDTALDYGSDGTRTSLAILKLMCSTVFTDRKCHVDTCSYNLPANTPLCDHLHISLQPDSSNYTSPMDLVELIISTASDSDNFSAVLSVGLAISKSLHYF